MSSGIRMDSTTPPSVHDDAPWPHSDRSRAFQLGLCTFAILALELALIRWISGQIRLVAYFANIILLAAFLGMGLGIALGRKRPALIHACLPALAVLSAVLCFSAQLHLMQLRFPDLTISLWGADTAPSTAWQFAGITMLMTVLFGAVASVFAFAAAPVGWLFDRLPPLRAYSADLLGSLLGVVTMTALAALRASPPVWLAVGALPLLWFSRRALSIAAAVAIVGLAAFSARGAYFSPYNRIDITVGPRRSAAQDPLRRDWMLNVNRDFHQFIFDLSDRVVNAASGPTTRGYLQQVYELPFRTRGAASTALVVGAGTGNDVAAALRRGYQKVTAVEIDPLILDMGGILHPEHPYEGPRVELVNDDARAYFQRHAETRYDVVDYGLLDSHAMFSAMSSLRLDNYVYTREGLAAGWAHVKPGGIMAVSFSVFAGPWIEERMLRTISEATGRTPIVVHHGVSYGVTYLVGRDLTPAAIPEAFRSTVTVRPTYPASTQVPTDNWPFLYLRPGSVPYGYLAVLTMILLCAGLAVRGVYGREIFTRRGLDVPLFFMGAAFMLLETRMVTELSLLFGSTWIVNASVFGGVLLMVLCANLYVVRRAPRHVQLW
ncbi:MAG: hypothetical protein M3Z05_21520, partial [Gemmatimonadota bacterium]|nr:hypothetical protein [Gemmatimonadota bacterium]